MDKKYFFAKFGSSLNFYLGSLMSAKKHLLSISKQQLCLQQIC